MQTVFYIFIGVFSLLGLGTLNTASQFGFRHLGLTFGGMSYLGGAIAAYSLDSWWALLVGFGLTFVFRFLFGG